MITIVGAGPVGNYLAYLLSKEGKDVRVVEEHSEVGKPVQCAGIVTGELEKIIPIQKKFLINKIKKAKIYSSKNNFIDVKLRKENLVIDRSKFDFYLHGLAKKEGTEYIFNERFKGNVANKIKIGEKILKTDYLVGADGPFSQVAKQNSMFNGRRFVIGSQVRANLNCDKEVVKFFPGIGCFGWVIPENEEIARVGIVAYEKPQIHLDKLIDKLNVNKVIDRQGGFIPIYNPKQMLQKDNVFLVGDAATQIKSTSFGGLIPGMMAANELSRDFKNYSFNVRKKLHKDLYIGLLMHKVMNKFNEKEFDEFIGYFKKEKVKKILEENDRDFPSKFMFQLAFAEPRLFKYLKKLVF